MESRWYLFAGQSLENTKISDRPHALHITQTNWDNITRHLDRKKLLQEAADREAAVKRYLDDGSKNMTKEWENSLENVRRRKNEERTRLIEQRKEERARKFVELRKEQEEIRTKYMEKVDKQKFMTTGHAKALTSGLIASEVLHERQEQQKLQERIKNHEKEEDLKYWQQQTKKIEEANKKEEEKQLNKNAKNRAWAADLKKSTDEKHLLQKTLKEEEVRKEIADNIEAKKEMDRLEQLIQEDMLKKKQDLLRENQKYLKDQRDFEQQKLKEDKELDEVIAIYQTAKHRIDCLKKQKIRELRDATVERRQKISNMMTSEKEAVEEAERRALAKAVAEKEEIELEKIKEKQEYAKKIKEERLKDQQDAVKREELKKCQEDEIRKWETMNRYKTQEAMKQYDEMKRKEMWKKIMEFRADLCEQMEDRRLEMQREKEIDEAFQEPNLDAQDNKFFSYAEEVLAMAKKKGRNTYPIKKVIMKYMKEIQAPKSKLPSAIELYQNPCTELQEIIKNTQQKSKKCKCKK